MWAVYHVLGLFVTVCLWLFDKMVLDKLLFSPRECLLCPVGRSIVTKRVYSIKFRDTIKIVELAFEKKIPFKMEMPH